MSADETTRLRALLERATRGPWRVGRRGMAMQWSAPDRIGQLVERHEIDSVDVTEPNNAALIVAAVNALPGLLDAAERAERADALLDSAGRRILNLTAERNGATERAECAERERDDLAALNVARVAAHAHAMARVAELEARLASSRLRGAADVLAFVHAVISGVVHGLAEDEGKAVLMGALDAHREGWPVTLRAEFAAPTAEVSRG